GDMVKRASLEITQDNVQFGSMRMDGDTVGSLLRVSPQVLTWLLKPCACQVTCWSMAMLKQLLVISSKVTFLACGRLSSKPSQLMWTISRALPQDLSGYTR